MKLLKSSFINKNISFLCQFLGELLSLSKFFQGKIILWRCICCSISFCDLHNKWKPKNTSNTGIRWCWNSFFHKNTGFNSLVHVSIKSSHMQWSVWLENCAVFSLHQDPNRTKKVLLLVIYDKIRTLISPWLQTWFLPTRSQLKTSNFQWSFQLKIQ